MEDEELKWYYIDYDTFGLETEIQAHSIIEAEDLAKQQVIDLGVDFTIEEMEE